jgi:hypothetical protein
MKLAAEARERAQEWDAMAAEGGLGGLGLQVRARITWKSASGVPRHEEFNDLVI